MIGDVIRVVIADDQPLIRAGLRAVLESDPDVEVVAEAGDGAEAAARAREHEADVVLMDVQMPGTDGLVGTRMAITARPTVRVLVLTMFDLDENVLAALRAGASGFLLKSTDPREFLHAIRAVHRGDLLFAPSITRRLVESFLGSHRRPGGEQSALGRLTPREREVFELMARGASNAEIADALFLSGTTVKSHVARVLDKLDLRDRVQAVVLGYELGVVVPGDLDSGT